MVLLITKAVRGTMTTRAGLYDNKQTKPYFCLDRLYGIDTNR